MAKTQGPAFMQEQFGGLDPAEVEMPRLKLLQASSPELTKFNEAKQGEFWHRLIDASFGSTVRICPIYIDKRFILWRPREAGGGILARADDGKHWAPHDAEFTVNLKNGHEAHTNGGLKHYHEEEIQSISLRTEKPLDPDKFFPWVQDLVAKEGPKILRCKGILSFKDDPERFVFQGVHMILDGDHQRAWKDGEERLSRIVFIGRDLPEDKIRQGFESCVA